MMVAPRYAGGLVLCGEETVNHVRRGTEQH